MPKKKPRNSQPEKEEKPWETVMKIMKGPFTPAKATGLGLFLMLFGAPFDIWGTGAYLTIGQVCVAFGVISFIVGILSFLGFIDLKKL